MYLANSQREMFRNYLKIAFRNLKKNKLYSFVNIAGLAIGMAVSILILSYVWFELSFDRFHSKSDQIYRVVHTSLLNKSGDYHGRTGNQLALALKEEFPEILNSARLLNTEIELSYDGIKFNEGVAMTDPGIFDIFDINLTLGDSKTALLDSNSIILTEEESKKLFGEEYPIGKFINLHEGGPEATIKGKLKVTGVAKAMPDNSHFSFRFLIPYRNNWMNNMFSRSTYTYITLPRDYQPENLENKFPKFVKKYIAPQLEKRFETTYDIFLKSGKYYRLELQPLKVVHLVKDFGPEPFIKKGNIFHVQMYTVIALFIIALACINFITLSTARSGIRAKEVGIRKVSGAKRVELIKQFLTESILLSVIALVFAVLMVAIFSKPFNNLLEIQTSSGIVFIMTALLVVSLVVGVIAGSYPAFVLSAFRPVNVLKGQLSEKMKGMSVRNSLVVFQFITSIILIISSIVVYKQFIYMQNKDLGFDKENIIILKNARALYYQDRENISPESRELRAISFRQEILKYSNVINATYTGNVPGFYNLTESGSGYQWNFRFRLEGEPSDASNGMPSTFIDHAYFDVFGLEMVAGENFRENPLSQVETAIINETAMNKFGLKNPVGKYLYIKKSKSIINKEGKQEWVRTEVPTLITGVFKDFHNRDLNQVIKETLFFQMPEGRTGQYLAIRFMPGNISYNIAFLEKTWEKFKIEEPFEYSFFDQEFEDLYNKEKRLAHIFTFFTFLGIFIACLGIFGLAAFTAEQRTKEIGIRKVLGASIQDIVAILSKIYLKLLIVAILLACPLGYIVMSRWLQEFPFHTKLGATIFIFTGLITVIIVLSSVSYHSIKAAMTDPARTLKYE